MLMLGDKKRKKVVRTPYWNGGSLVVSIPPWGRKILGGIFGGEMLQLELTTTPGPGHDLPTLRIRKIAEEGAIVKVRKIGTSMVFSLPVRMREALMNLKDNQYVEIIEGDWLKGDPLEGCILVRHNPAMDGEPAEELTEQVIEKLTEQELYERVTNRLEMTRLRVERRKKRGTLRKMEGMKGVKSIWYDPRDVKDRGDQGDPK